MTPIQPTIQGRGVANNPANRFERLHRQPEAFDDPDILDGGAAQLPQTVYLHDTSQSIISENDSPDVPFRYSINPYRGCSHGCVYCYARPTHEWLGFSAGLDFETQIMVKSAAPELLRKELMKPKYSPDHLSMSGVTDCYQPAEKQFRITRGCLEVLAEFRHPVGIVTKNHLVTRDIDLLSSLAKLESVAVYLSITTLDPELSRKMEPRTSSPRRRLEAVKMLADAGIPVGVLTAPVIPGLNDHEIPNILKAAAEAGARFAGFVSLRLPHGVAPMFEEWLGLHYPNHKEKVLSRIKSMRDGKLNDANFGSRMTGTGIWAEQIRAMFELGKKAAGIEWKMPRLEAKHFKRPGEQLKLW